jgi:ribonuclease P protein component
LIQENKLDNYNEKFPEKHRIKKKEEIKRLFKNGKRLFSDFYIFIYCMNEYSYPRVGIIVSKKVGKAYKRNYEKRLIREFFRKNKVLIKNYDLLIIRNKREGVYKEKEEDFLCKVKVIMDSKVNE